MKHKDKLKLARRNMTQDEITNHVSPFDSQYWNKRKDARQARHEEKNAGEHKRAEERKAKALKVANKK